MHTTLNIFIMGNNDMNKVVIPKQYRRSYIKHIILISIIITIINLITQMMAVHSYQDRLLNINSIFSKMSNFDGMQFITNNYQYQQNYVFLPGFTILLQIYKYLFNQNLVMTILLITTTNRILIYFTTKQLYLICKHRGISSYNSYICGLLFIYNPAAIFYHSVYSESIYAFIVFMMVRIYLYERNILKCLIILMFASIIRSTALFLVPVIGITILAQFIDHIQKLEIKKVIFKGIQGTSIIILLCLPFCCYLIWAYFNLCQKIEESEKCTKFINVYSWIQQKYWNVGFLKYYTLNNILFIGIGTPSIIFSIVSYRINKKKLELVGIDLSWAILLIITIFLTNVQSSTRFFSSHPIFYVNMLDSLLFSKIRLMRKIILCWWMFYCYLGVFLFYLGFPWT